MAKTRAQPNGNGLCISSVGCRWSRFLELRKQFATGRPYFAFLQLVLGWVLYSRVIYLWSLLDEVLAVDVIICLK